MEEQINNDVRKAFNDLPDFVKEQMAAEMESSFTDMASDFLNADEGISKVEVFKIVARQIDKLIRVIFSYEELHEIIRLICIKYNINFETYLQLVFKLCSWLSSLTDEEIEICLELVGIRA